MSDFPGSSTTPWGAPEATGDDQTDAPDVEVEIDEGGDDESDGDGDQTDAPDVEVTAAPSESDTPATGAVVVDGRSGDEASADDPIPTDDPTFTDDGVIENPGADVGVVPREKVERGHVDDYMNDPGRLAEPPREERSYAPDGSAKPPAPDAPPRPSESIADADAAEATGVTSD